MNERDEDREAVEGVAAAFLDQPMEIDKRMPFILHHPFLNTPRGRDSSRPHTGPPASRGTGCLPELDAESSSW